MIMSTYYLHNTYRNLLGFIGKDIKSRQVVEYSRGERYEGIGKIRIGKDFNLREDCYGLVVLSQLKNEALDTVLKFKE